MTLAHPLWVTPALALGFTSGILWWSLRPQASDPLLPPPVERVDTVAATAEPIDLASVESLFAETPGNATPTSMTNATDMQAAPERPPRLVGLAIKRGGNAIALAIDAAGLTKTLKIRDVIDGWSLVGIAPDRAVFQKAERRETVTLDLFDKPPATADSAQTAMPSDRDPGGLR